jgi:hypothetical protein
MPELVINDDNFTQHMGDNRLLTLKPRLTAFGECEVATPIPRNMLIPRSDWSSHIKRKDDNGDWLKNKMEGIPCLDQNGLGYCHAYCTVLAMMAKRAQSSFRFALF